MEITTYDMKRSHKDPAIGVELSGGDIHGSKDAFSKEFNGRRILSLVNKVS